MGRFSFSPSVPFHCRCSSTSSSHLVIFFHTSCLHVPIQSVDNGQSSSPFLLRMFFRCSFLSCSPTPLRCSWAVLFGYSPQHLLVTVRRYSSVRRTDAPLADVSSVFIICLARLCTWCPVSVSYMFNLGTSTHTLTCGYLCRHTDCLPFFYTETRTCTHSHTNQHNRPTHKQYRHVGYHHWPVTQMNEWGFFSNTTGWSVVVSLAQVLEKHWMFQTSWDALANQMSPSSQQYSGQSKQKKEIHKRLGLVCKQKSFQPVSVQFWVRSPFKRTSYLAIYRT